MADMIVPGIPGVRTARVATPRNVFRQNSLDFLSQGRLIDGANARDPGNGTDLTTLRSGMLMGKITSSGLYAPSIIGGVTVAVTAGATSITVSVATATEILRRFGATGTFNLGGPAVANGIYQQETVTYSAIVTSTGVITCTATVNAYVINSFCMPTDGSQIIRSFLPDGFGTLVADADGNVITVQYPQIPISGVVMSNQLLPYWPSDLALQTHIISQLKAATAGVYVFDHEF